MKIQHPTRAGKAPRRYHLPPIKIQPALLGARWNRRGKYPACRWSVR
jgi:hypothetical protein